MHDPSDQPNSNKSNQPNAKMRMQEYIEVSQYFRDGIRFCFDAFKIYIVVNGILLAAYATTLRPDGEQYAIIGLIIAILGFSTSISCLYFPKNWEAYCEIALKRATDIEREFGFSSKENGGIHILIKQRWERYKEVGDKEVGDKEVGDKEVSHKEASIIKKIANAIKNILPKFDAIDVLKLVIIAFAIVLLILLFVVCRVLPGR